MVDKIGGRYAEAIYEIALEEKKVVAIYELLQEAEDLYNNNIEFKGFLQHPLVKKDDKLDIIEKIFANKEEIEKNILLYLIDRGRMLDIKDILLEYKKMYYDANNIVDVKATFATEISEEQKLALIKKLEKTTNKKIELELVIDKTLIGGGIIKIGDKIVDGSIKAQLKDMAKVQ
ncbi:MAG: ATP synthase F1 subunit delta [Fusobacteriaceae bacterium]